MVHKLTLRVVLTVTTTTGEAPSKEDIARHVEAAINMADNNPDFRIEKADVRTINED